MPGHHRDGVAGTRFRTLVGGKLSCDSVVPPCFALKFEGRYSIAGNAVTLQFGSERFRNNVAPAFRHLECSAGSKEHSNIAAYDLASAPGAAGFFGSADGRWWRSRYLAPRQAGSDDGRAQQQGNLVTAVDWRLNTAYWLVADAAAIPYIERASPLRLLLSYLARDPGAVSDPCSFDRQRHGG